ncbi:unnamed protein product [Bursaphelenchus xylophilus]|uniref:non-specific serine/threonine protein kinase n=1 Tax=Bursaphelenchus xylophilus TaxID=6326 RepID=A0A1I7S273_BURXY|nr:unnamed protein product [Bursaphelenchus xylophilus]CAG9114844.1 unnamed protein product [Bursaphelenchus xylophilus]
MDHVFARLRYDASSLPLPGDREKEKDELKIDYPTNMDGYREIEELGEGCFAKVMLAQVLGCRHRVALKMIDLTKIEDKTAMQCAEREFELARKLLKHSNIVRTFATFKDPLEKTLVMVMEYMPNGDLERYIHTTFLSKNKLTPEARIWLYFEQISAAIEFMHSKRIIHRDLKPANVMLANSWRVKVGDFGLSRMRSAATVEVKTVCGTPYYMSPERILQKGYTYASDVWSLGCILYELATAVSPFFGERHNSYSLSNKVELADYPPIPEDCYSPFLHELVDLCLTADFMARPPASVVHEYSRIMVHMFAKYTRF